MEKIVEIKPLKEALKDFARAYGEIKKRKLIKRNSIGFSSTDCFVRFFSGKN